jgi:beta-phosphoglucomutase
MRRRESRTQAGRFRGRSTSTPRAHFVVGNHKDRLSRLTRLLDRCQRTPVGYIFDLDGVLINSMPSHVEAWRAGFARCGVEVRVHDLYLREGEDQGKTAADLFKSSRRRQPSATQLATIVDTKNRLYAEAAPARFFPGARELLSALAGCGRKLALVTGSVDVGHVFRAREDFLKIFDVVVSGVDTVCAKPYPEPYETAVAKLAISPQRCVVIENSPLGVTSARQAGLLCVGILANSPLSARHLSECGADRVHRSLREFRETLRSSI